MKQPGRVVLFAVLLALLPFPGEEPLSQAKQDFYDDLFQLSDDTSHLPPMRVLVAGEAAVKNGRRPPCPEGMTDMGAYCIDKQMTPAPANWYVAADFCQAKGKRLCANEEWLQACDASPLNGVESMPEGGPEWLSSWVFDTSGEVFDSMEHGYFRCRTSSQPRPSSRPFEPRPFRCCQ